jgi:hypothetical protein
VVWRSKNYYASGAPEKEGAAGATLGVIQGAEHRWAVDGASGCLVPAGSAGPFLTGLRFNAAVDRLTGAAERHSTACLEFRPGPA